jgi:hypothetical protein
MDYHGIKGDHFGDRVARTRAELPQTLKLHAPCCMSDASEIFNVPLLIHATDVKKYRCRSCGALWQVIIRPLGWTDPGFAHRLEWLCLEGEKAKGE